VEVESCYLAPGPEDRFHLVEGGLGVAHAALPGNRAVQDLILGELGLRPQRVLYPRGVVRTYRAGAWAETCCLSLTPWAPRHIAVRARQLKGVEGTLVVEGKASAPTDALPACWLWVCRGETWEIVPVHWEGRRFTVSLASFGTDVSTVYVGGRAAVPVGDLVSQFRRSRTPQVTWQVSFRPGEITQASAGAPADGPAPAQEPTSPVCSVPAVTGDSSAAYPRPTIRAKLKTKQTTHRREERTYHVRWEWDFGDGSQLTDGEATHLVSAVNHTFTAPGVYRVKATSVANTGEVLREKTWDVHVPPGELMSWQGSLETLREPGVRVSIASPQEWMVGRPALIRVSAQIEETPELVGYQVEFDPGREFVMIWERPGQFPIKAAAIVTLRYRLPEGERTIRNTYLAESWVNVLTTAGND